MPRACPVEPHVVSYCSGEREAPRDKPVASRNRAALCSDEREAPRDKPVASRAVWLRLIFKDHKPTAKFKAPRCGGGICEVNAGKQTSHISQTLKQSSIRRLLFKIKMDKV